MDLEEALNEIDNLKETISDLKIEIEDLKNEREVIKEENDGKQSILNDIYNLVVN
jgi:FtsZ-binding cell division protein ZapB